MLKKLLRKGTTCLSCTYSGQEQKNDLVYSRFRLIQCRETTASNSPDRESAVNNGLRNGVEKLGATADENHRARTLNFPVLLTIMPYRDV